MLCDLPCIFLMYLLCIFYLYVFQDTVDVYMTVVPLVRQHACMYGVLYHMYLPLPLKVLNTFILNISALMAIIRLMHS